ncbi:MAG: hypothetical protein WA323_11940 [Candidatus Nitrosopolaris sp.]
MTSEEITKCSSSCFSYNQTLSEEHEERIEREIDNDNGDFEENSDIAEPVEIIREEVVEVVENPTAETFPLSSMETQHEDEEEQKKEIKTENLNRYNEDIYEQVKAQSIQLNSLAEMVESLQSQVQQLQETTRLRKHHNTISVRKKRTSNSSTKTKRKTKTRGSARSRKK